MVMEDPIRSRKPRRVWIWSAVALVVVIGGVGATVVARNADGDAKNKKKTGKQDDVVAAPVEVVSIKRGSIATFLTTTTTLEARNSATLVSRGQGEVIALVAEEGQWVERGGVLARLDDTDASLSVQRTEVALETAKREADRGRQLKGQGYMSDKEIDDLELKLRQAQVEHEQAKHNLSQMRIVAPFSGRVTDRMVSLGETVPQGKECFRMAEFEPLLARVYFPERELPYVHVGQTATIEVDSSPGVLFPAKVSLVNPMVDRANGTFKVTLEVHDAQGRLRPGGFARARIRTGSFDDALLMARRAIVDEDGESYVFVARRDTVARTKIQVGAISGDTVQVLGGIAEGDSVVTVGQGGLKTGAKIKPVSF
jgi:membrane fusion protein (multidrug efflux system)